MEQEPQFSPEADKREKVVEQTLDALKVFCEKYGVPLEGRHLQNFREALEEKGGSFQWTPSAPAFKRITLGSPSETKRALGWDGRLAAVILNGDDFSEELTDELNSAIHDATGNQWQEDESL